MPMLFNLKMSFMLSLTFDLTLGTFQTSFPIFSGPVCKEHFWTYRKLCCIGTGNIVRKLQ